jgi:hypothetical protein
MDINEAPTSAQKSVTPNAYATMNMNAAEIAKAKTQTVKSPDRKWYLHQVIQQIIPSLSAQVIMQKQQEAEMQQQELEAQQQAQEQTPEQENPEQTA